MTAPSRVDIVIPLFDKASVIGRAVASVLAQTMTEWRLVVVDDGSTDGWTLSVDDPRISVVSQANAGPGAARNAGVALGTSPLLAFLDADDVWEPDYLAVTLSLLDRDDEVGAVCTAWSGPRRSPTTAAASIEPIEWTWSEELPPAELKSRVDSLHTSATVVRRALFEEYGGFFENGVTYGEDSYLWLAIAMTRRVVLIPRELVRFTVEHSTLSSGRASAYPIPPLLASPARFLSNLDPSRQAYMRRYLGHYARFVVTRSVREGRDDQARALLSSDIPRGLGLRRVDVWALHVARALVAGKQVAKRFIAPLRSRAGRVPEGGRRVL